MEGKKKIFVGMSGGVDSSVSAALLKEAGHEVTGVFIKVWQADFLPCTWREERREAMRAAAHINIPFLTLDLSAEYKKDVVDYMIREYGVGRVPNPDVMCNKHVKFGAFLKFALEHGADAVATGHYARVVNSQQSAVTSTYKMLKGVDSEKDQTYFLWTLTQEELRHTLFPVGHLHKSEVRALAKKFGLPNAEKKDSQGLCFIGKVDVAEFLRHFLKLESGNVLDEAGNVIGQHDGALLYTIGQRQGIRYRHRSPNDVPLFVVSKDIGKNTVTVAQNGPESGVPRPEIMREIRLDGLVTISGFPLPDTGDLMARYRYRGELEAVSVDATGERPVVRFMGPKKRRIAPGQSLVLYCADECLGGGVISVVD